MNGSKRTRLTPGFATGGGGAELTLRAACLGILLSIVMGAANVYVGLKAGMTVSASIPAAVMAMLTFRLLRRPTNLREANQVQTCASAGESLAAGIIFTMPAMILIGYWDDFDFWTVTVIAATGGLLGILLMIPMRHVFIADNRELPYPEGVACAAVLEAGIRDDPQGDAGSRGDGRALLRGGGLGAAFTVAGKGLGVIVESLEGAVTAGGRIFFFGGDLSPMLVAVGFIVRLNVALLIFIGGAAAWLLGLPLLGGGDAFDDPVDGAYELWGTQIRYVGVGAMVVGGFGSLIAVRHGLRAAVVHMAHGLTRPAADTDEKERDLPSAAVLALAIICIVLLTGVNHHFTGDIVMTALVTVAMALLSFFFTAVACHIVGLVGNSNSPVSGMTITAVLATGGILWLAGYSGQSAMVATLGIAAVVCCVTCTSGDVCNDLKTGWLVGATPWRQQLMQILGVIVAAGVMAPVLSLLHAQADGGIGGRELSAPQASLFQSLVEGFAGRRNLPWGLIAIGGGVGLVVLAIDEWLKRRRFAFRLHLMPLAVGMYLPFGVATPILIGGLLAHRIGRIPDRARRERHLHRGVLFSSGVIAGEALMAVLLAIVAVAGLTLPDLGLSPSTRISLSILAAVLAVGAFGSLTRAGRKAH